MLGNVFNYENVDIAITSPNYFSDGKQSPGTNFSIDEELEIARQLDLLGIAVGFPAACETERLAEKRIVQLNLRAHVGVAARATESDIDLAVEYGEQEPHLRGFTIIPGRLIRVSCTTCQIHSTPRPSSQSRHLKAGFRRDVAGACVKRGHQAFFSRNGCRFSANGAAALHKGFPVPATAALALALPPIDQRGASADDLRVFSVRQAGGTKCNHDCLREVRVEKNLDAIGVANSIKRRNRQSLPERDGLFCRRSGENRRSRATTTASTTGRAALLRTE